jgi:hypothetical protein
MSRLGIQSSPASIPRLTLIPIHLLVRGGPEDDLRITTETRDKIPHQR